MKPIVAFPSRHPFLLCDDAIAMLKNAGFDLIFNRSGRKLTDSEQKEFIKDAFAIIAGTEKYDREMLAGCDNLKTIIRFGVGVDNFDLEAMRDLGIEPGVIANNNAVAEFTLMLMLAVLKNLPRYDTAVRNGTWARYEMHELNGKTIGLIGFGRIAKRLAKLLQGFEVQIYAYSRHICTEEAEEYGVIPVGLEKLLAESDIVSLHIPATEENLHFIDKNRIAKMKDGAILINTARGKLIDEVALIEALRSGKLNGAGLDVYELEPVTKDNPLFSLQNDVLSPHVSALTVETNYNAGITCANSIISVYNGGKVIFPVS